MISFDPIHMSYAELYPSLVLLNLIQPRNLPQIPEPLPWWYKPELRCGFHQGAPEHDIENCYPLKYEIQKLMKSGMVSFEGPVLYSSDKVVPYQYNATMMKDGQEVPLPTTISVVSIADATTVTRSGRMFGLVFPKDKEESVVGKKVEVPAVDPINDSKGKSGESRDLKANDDDEVVRLIKRSEFNMVEQLLQTPSKILVLSLLMNSEAHIEALQKFLEQAFVEHDVTVDQFNHIVANITSYNNLSFCDEELLKEGRNHNLALHISMNCKDDALSNVLVDTGPLLNVLSRSTLEKLSYQRAPMRYSGVIVKAFDGSRKTLIGEMDVPVKIGPSDFQITFQVMDIHLAYSCLLGRPWIHEAGVATFTLHQKLKFVKNGKLVIIGEEKALLVSHLSSFSYVEAEDEVGTLFQALSITAEKRVGAPMSSLKDAKKIVEEGNVDQWGRMVEISDNKGKTSLGFQ
ncbi:hypothetical protein KIW84_061918 [Lathyrus oleraceus]|uniref:Uncharacterized protein n=1 Tax=Pisum sativum TaxID=3888 RepID=A0A9D5A4V0_PEA|nr:hypothetical protein KIW84_061918 [Pisum sativum]